MKRQSASRYKLCAHVMDDGHTCGSPALRRRAFCYYHDELLRRRKRIAELQLRYERRQRDMQLREEQRRQNAALFARQLRSSYIKKILINSFDEKTLQAAFGISRSSLI